MVLFSAFLPYTCSNSTIPRYRYGIGKVHMCTNQLCLHFQSFLWLCVSHPLRRSRTALQCTVPGIRSSHLTWAHMRRRAIIDIGKDCDRHAHPTVHVSEHFFSHEYLIQRSWLFGYDPIECRVCGMCATERATRPAHSLIATLLFGSSIAHRPKECACFPLIWMAMSIAIECTVYSVAHYFAAMLITILILPNESIAMLFCWVCSGSSSCMCCFFFGYV